MDHFEVLLESWCQMSNCFLVSDMNVNLLELSAIGNRCLNSLKLNRRYQGKKEPTRVTTPSESLLVHIVHNDCLNKLEFDVIKTNFYRSLCTLCPLGYNKISIHSFSTNQGNYANHSEWISYRKNLNYLRHCLELSNSEQDVDMLTEGLADALTTAVNVFTFKETKTPCKFKRN